MDNKVKALEYCIEIYHQYTRVEVSNFHGCIIRAWKVGKRVVSKEKETIEHGDVCDICGGLLTIFNYKTHVCKNI